jgi:hypothetical protein
MLNQYMDKCLRNNWLKWVIEKIQSENIRQIGKWGVQTHSAFEWLTYTTEELGSLAKTIGEHEYRGGPKERIVSEAIQVATLALKIAEMFEREAADEEEGR